MNPHDIASYARVSTEHQAEAQTIASQVAALQARAAADGLLLLPDRQFTDDGYSGATLIRPALEQLRDLIAAGEIKRLYVLSPDRLARKYAYQVLLLDEFARAGVEVVFLNRALAHTPEDALLLQVQGMVAEYEQAQLLERSRRGKRHAAKLGAVTGLSTAPYGYVYRTKQATGGHAHLEIVEEEARIVREIFTWVGGERLSMAEVARRLQAAGVPTRTGKARWDRSTIWGMLKNPTYMGQAAYGKTRAIPVRPRLRAVRGHRLHPKRASGDTAVPREEWITIAVPAIVSEDLFLTVQGQLDENRQRARLGQRGMHFLLQGLVVCPQCGYALYGKPTNPPATGGRRHVYTYYRCVGTDGHRFGGEKICTTQPVRMDLLDVAVWQEVCTLLEDPGRVEHEYHARLAAVAVDEHPSRAAQMTKLQQGIARLIDSYTEGLIEKGEFAPRLTRLRQRLAQLEEQAAVAAETAALKEELGAIVERLAEFAREVQAGLARADWLTRRDLIRLLVKRVEVGATEITVVFRVSPHPFDRRPEWGASHYCWRRQGALLWTIPFEQPATAGAGPSGACWTSPILPTTASRHRGGSGSRRAVCPARGALPAVWRADGTEADCAADESKPTTGTELCVRADGSEQPWQGGHRPRCFCLSTLRIREPDWPQPGPDAGT